MGENIKFAIKILQIGVQFDTDIEASDPIYQISTFHQNNQLQGFKYTRSGNRTHIYGGMYRILNKLCSKWKISHNFLVSAMEDEI